MTTQHSIKSETKILINPDDLNLTIKQNSFLSLYIIIDNTTTKTLINNYNLEKNAEIKVNIIYFGNHKNTLKIKSNTKHLDSNSKSNISIKSILFDESKIDCASIIEMPKNIREAKGHFEHHTLLLSQKSSAKTVPSLKIESENIEASHAATIGKMDENLLFYLQSRGLSRKQSRQLLIKAFVFKNLNKIEDKNIEKEFNKKIEKLLNENMINYCKNKTCCNNQTTTC